MKNSVKKGFTLIELLIVIAIVGILAVAFVPTLLDAPARGRDSQRVANLNTIRTVLLNAELTNPADIPGATGCVAAANFNAFTAEFGGNIPTDPTNIGPTETDTMGACAGGYLYSVNPDGNNTYSFGLVARMETADAANATCADLPNILPPDPNGDGDDWCYVILVQ